MPVLAGGRGWFTIDEQDIPRKRLDGNRSRHASASLLVGQSHAARKTIEHSEPDLRESLPRVEASVDVAAKTFSRGDVTSRGGTRAPLEGNLLGSERFGPRFGPAL